MQPGRKPVKLEIGPGENPLGSPPEWTHLDFDDFLWGRDPIPLGSGTVDELYASHVLEHVPWTQTAAALAEALRVLAPGGLLELWVPDFGYIISCYQNHVCGDAWRRHNPAGDPMTWVNGRIFTYGPDERNWHHACFDSEHLRKVVQAAGFTDARICPERRRGTSHGLIDLGVTARKP
jgi:predicted SAM-dependent methyltransferase